MQVADCFWRITDWSMNSVRCLSMNLIYEITCHKCVVSPNLREQVQRWLLWVFSARCGVMSVHSSTCPLIRTPLNSNNFIVPFESELTSFYCSWPVITLLGTPAVTSEHLTGQVSALPSWTNKQRKRTRTNERNDRQQRWLTTKSVILKWTE